MSRKTYGRLARRFATWAAAGAASVLMATGQAQAATSSTGLFTVNGTGGYFNYEAANGGYQNIYTSLRSSNYVLNPVTFNFDPAPTGTVGDLSTSLDLPSALAAQLSGASVKLDIFVGTSGGASEGTGQTSGVLENLGGGPFTMTLVDPIKGIDPSINGHSDFLSVELGAGALWGSVGGSTATFQFPMVSVTSDVLPAEALADLQNTYLTITGTTDSPISLGSNCYPFGGGCAASFVNSFNIDWSVSVTNQPIGASSPAPEPGTWAMLIVGFAFAGLALRRRGVLAAAA